MRRLTRSIAAGAFVLLAGCSSVAAPASIENSNPTSTSPTSTSSVEAITSQSPTTTQPVVGSTTEPPQSISEQGPVRVSASDVVAALAGNTAVGNWVGEDYRQFFDNDGSTTYVPDGGRSSVGQWRVDETTSTYESLWPPIDRWDAYEVFRDGDQWFWNCLLYTSPSPRDRTRSRMPSSA